MSEDEGARYEGTPQPTGSSPPQPYDPCDFEHLDVEPEVKESFKLIGSYTGRLIETGVKFRPFLLDFLPAVGEPDAFLKVGRPDHAEDSLGLKILDEPALKQSDPAVFDLQLRAMSRSTPSSQAAAVMKKLARADKNPKEIEQWIKSVADFHKSKPATVVHYSKPMPSLESLMQEWPPDIEETLSSAFALPTAENCSNLTLEQYSDLICALLDIPVHKSRVHSLHVLFSLYMQFKNSPHFRLLAEEKSLGGKVPPGNTTKADTLIL